jgi:nicotinamide-nucleotide amidase
MIAEIITIGDELLIGQVLNTNATWIAQQLHTTGINVYQVSAVSDTQEHILSALDEAFQRSDLILLTGGLGPTKDDITKDTLCEYFHTKLVFHRPSFENIKKFFLARGWEVTDRNRRQAEIPANCIPISNNNGTAPGMWFEKDKRIIVSLPGVPFEMEAMMEEYVLPHLSTAKRKKYIFHKTIQTVGMGESYLTEMIREWEDSLPAHIRLAYLPQPGIVRLRLSATGSSLDSLRQEVEEEAGKLLKLIPDLIYGYENDTLEEAVGNLLKNQGLTICTAESCTGGYIAHLITSIPGSSEYFKGSVVAYSNEIKEKILGVRNESLIKFGAVSEQVVMEMATGSRERFSTDYSIAVSGIAGPAGGTTDKPVGTTWIGVATPDDLILKKFMFGDHRGRNIHRAALAALNMLRLELLKDGG